MVTRVRRYLERKGWLKHQPPLFIPFRPQILLSMKRPVNIESIQSSIANKVKNLDDTQVKKMNEAIDYLISKKRRKDASNLFVAALRAFISMDKKKGTSFALDRIHHIPDGRAVKSLVNQLMKDGNVSNL